MEDMIANIMESMPGFKFHPSDDELLLLYLMPKIEGTQVEGFCVVPEVEVCKFDPWHLPKLFDELSVWKSQEGAREWIFFCPRKRKYSNSQRSERTTPSGKWKVTGVDRTVKAEDGTSIGTKKTVVFYEGPSRQKGKKTSWVMHEYHLNASCLSDDSYGDQLPYLACRLKLKKDNKAVTTSDYPTEGSSNNSPYTSDGADHSQVSGDDSSLYNTPTTATPENHQATGDPYTAAQYEISLDDVYRSLPNLQQLDDSAMFEHTAHDGSNAFNNGYMPPPPLSPWNTYEDNSGFGWVYSSGSYN